ncbi:hypothetical protein D3C71_2093120 [compost metagenome]
MRVVGWPPPAQLIPTRISDTPISVITVPVTTGGNSPSMRPIIGAISTPNSPDAITAP